MTVNTFDRKHAEGFYTSGDIAALYGLQDGKCYFCDAQLGKLGEKSPFHIDHLSPISKGGTNWPGNLSLSCPDCNKRKYNQDTAKLWKKLRAEKGDSWYQEKIARNRSHTARKSQLTKERKVERQESLALIAEKLEEALTAEIREGAYASPSEFKVSVDQLGVYLSIWFNNSHIEFPAPTQAEIQTWVKQDYVALAACLVITEALSGYLKVGSKKIQVSL
ncbi:MAG: HNH endonuclease [Rhizobacter sp.]|nr:HNH endonuclease [Rhizobacter sp.]